MTCKPSVEWVKFVNKIMVEKKCHHAAAWNLAARENPTLATLVGAFGRSRQCVSFFNSKLPVPEAAGAEFVNEMSRGKGYVTVTYGGRDVSRAPGRRQFANGTQTRDEMISTSNTSKNATPPQYQTSTTSETGCPVMGPKHAAIFRIPASTPQDLFQAIWTANGCTLSPINPGKCMAGAADYFASKGGTYDAALAQAKTQLPDLWQLVQNIAATPI